MNKTEHRTIPTPGQLGFSLLGAACILLLLFYSDSAVSAVQNGLDLCGKTVIPALFPFMVASELFVGSGGAAALGRLLARPMHGLLGVPGAAACPILLGTLCGFPTGARAMASLYDKGALTSRQCTRLLTFINNPSSAYMISAVGFSLLGSRRLGLMLYAISLLCALITALITRFLLPDNDSAAQPIPQPVRLGADTFTSAVTGAAQSMLAVCAYVLFFSAVLGALQSACARLALSPMISALLYGMVEMSGGIARAARIEDPEKAAMLCAALSCWSGVSVMCQIMTVCHGRSFRFFPYVLAKLAQGLLAAALTGLAVRYLLPLLPPEDTHAALMLPESTTQFLTGLVDVTFIMACAAAIPKMQKPTPERTV
ncbi:MAG: hypothetical protein IJW70_07620 [Clostridia bacterium]|nr:hypothetical protein [Clostridia bacterium]